MSGNSLTINTAGTYYWDDTSFDSGTNITSLQTRDGYNAYIPNGTSSALVVDQDTRYGKNSTPFNGQIASIVPSASNGGSIQFDARNVRLIPYNTGSGSVPPFGVTVSQGSASGKLAGVYSALNAAPVLPGAAMPSTGWIKVRQWNGTAYAAGALTIGNTGTTQLILQRQQDFENLTNGTTNNDFGVSAGTAGATTNMNTQKRSGTYSLRVAATGTTTIDVRMYPWARFFCPAGLAITCSVYAYADDAKTVAFSIDWYDANGTYLSNTSIQASALSATTWTQLTTSAITAPSSTAYGSVKFSITTPTNGKFYYFADPSKASKDQKKKLKALGVAPDDIADFLGRLAIIPQYHARVSIDAVTQRLLMKLIPGHTAVIEDVYDKLLARVIAAHLGSVDSADPEHPLALQPRPGAEEQEAVEEHLLSRAELLSILPPVPALAAEQRRVLEAANGGALAMTDLEWKLRVAGAEEQTIARAQERRSVTSVRLAERPILDGDVDDELVGLEGRALEHADAVTADVVGSAAGSAQAGRPAEVIYGRLVQQTGQLGALDSDGVLDGDGGLVLGLVCELSDRCLFEWRSA